MVWIFIFDSFASLYRFLYKTQLVGSTICSLTVMFEDQITLEYVEIDNIKENFKINLNLVDMSQLESKSNI